MKIYNTLSRKKEVFRPLKKNKIKLFVCGPTVYDHSHIGHARTYISFDVIARYLKYLGYSVFYLQNITDIDDKIIKRAKEIDLNPFELAKTFENKYLEDMDQLGVRNVTFYARATEHIPEIIDQIKVLINKGYAYQTEKGIYFDEAKFSDFGKLSNQKREEPTVPRINPDKSKRNPGDFSLWKKKDEEPYWDSPWGKGRPGWHIEDTAITEEYFGPQYDIHGGGLDLIFPHHEAEIAQMESASGLKPMVRYWMHTGFLNVQGEKMSKSLGNFITIRELLEKYSPQVFRFFVLSTHYRSPIDFSDEILKQSQQSLKRLTKFMNRLERLTEKGASPPGSSDNSSQERIEEMKKKFFNAMDDDFNTPEAISIIFELTRYLNRKLDNNGLSSPVMENVKKSFQVFGNILGLDFFDNQAYADQSKELLSLIVEIRQLLREKKEYDISDKIRDRLNELGMELEDK